MNKVIEYLKKIFHFRKKFPLLIEEKEIVKKPENTKDISEKNITMYLYKLLRSGKIEEKYIDNKYLKKIKILLAEEKKIKQRKIMELKHQIYLKEKSIQKNN